jgi:hypothetical protein
VCPSGDTRTQNHETGESVSQVKSPQTLKPHQGAPWAKADEAEGQPDPEVRRRCSLKSSSEPEPRAAANHRDAAVRAAAATAAALPGRTSTAVVPVMRFHRSWANWKGDADSGAEGEWRRWLWWGRNWGLGFGAARSACCARIDWNFLRMPNPPGSVARIRVRLLAVAASYRPTPDSSSCVCLGCVAG